MLQMKIKEINVARKQNLAREKEEKKVNIHNQKEEKDQKEIMIIPNPNRKIIINDIEVWKKLRKINPNTKIFIVKGGYKDIKDDLLKRGLLKRMERKY